MLKKTHQQGFTLIELLVAATIIILLTTVGLISYRVVARNSRNAKRKSDAETIRQAAIMYRSDNNEYPNVSAENDIEKFDNLVSLLYARGYLTESAFTDPIDSGSYQYSYQNTDTDPKLLFRLEPDPPTDYVLNFP